MAGGGFKSFFDNPTTNNFMFTTNLNIGIWKWIEGYLDIRNTLKIREKNQDIFMELVLDLIYFLISLNCIFL